MSFCSEGVPRNQHVSKEDAARSEELALLELIRRLATPNTNRETGSASEAQPQEAEEIPLFPEEATPRQRVLDETDLRTEGNADHAADEGKVDEGVLRRLQDSGMVQLDAEGRIRVTSRGARALARLIVGEILDELARRRQQVDTRSVGYGTNLASWTRRYSLGDSYEHVDVERTLLNGLTRKPIDNRVHLRPEDFEIHETEDEDRLLVGILVDESRSMHDGGKLRAAVETSLALSEIILQRPHHKVRVFTYSDTFREIPFWDVVNQIMEPGATDMRGPLEAFRRAAKSFEGQKEVYLITDSEPNSTDGKYIGFQWARLRVLDEARYLRKEKITLNVVMLDERPRLLQFAGDLARQNHGRIFVTSPQGLGRVLIEDYLQRHGVRSARQRMNHSFVGPPSRADAANRFVQTSEVRLFNW